LKLKGKFHAAPAPLALFVSSLLAAMSRHCVVEETHLCVVDRDGKVILEARTPTAPRAIAAALAKGPTVERVLFETGRMAPTLFHGLTALGLSVVCVESRQAYQAEQ
jgi:hypothetical protein